MSCLPANHQVLKSFKHTGMGVNSIGRYEKMLTSHTVAKFLAKEFSEHLDRENVKEQDRLEYLDCCVVKYSIDTGNNIIPQYRWVDTQHCICKVFVCTRTVVPPAKSHAPSPTKLCLRTSDLGLWFLGKL